MNQLCRYLLAGLLAGVMTLTAPLQQSHAQSAPEPAVVISVADFTQQMGDIDYLVEASGFAQMKFMAQTMVKQYTKGIKADAPAGIMMFFTEDSEEPDFLGFVAVSNLDDLLDTISGLAEVDEGEDFTTIITDDETELLIKEVDGNAFFSNKESMFEKLPSDPASLLGDLPNKYNIAARVFGQRIPKSLRDSALDTIRDSYEQQLEQLEESEPIQAELQRKNFDMQMKQFGTWINETDNLVFGMCADKDTKSLYMDVEITALSDSELANRMAASKDAGKSMFTGFLMEGAAFTQNTCMKMLPEEAEEYSKMMDQVHDAIMDGLESEGEFSDDELEVAENALDKFMDVGKETMAEGHLDSGAVLMLQDGELNFAAGARLADPKKLEDAIKELVEFAESKMGDDIQVQLNSGSHQDVTMHQILIQIPDDEEEMRDVLGDQVTVIVGIGSKAVYLGFGSNPLKTIKQAMEGESSTPDGILQYNLHLTPILKFVANINGEPAVEAMAEAMEENGQDRMSMTSKLITDGMAMRFEMQDGILSLIQVGVESMQGAFPGNDNDF